MKNIILILCCYLLTTSCTDSNTPKHSSFVMNLSSEPSTLHPIRSTDAVASTVQSYILESLLIRNIDTYEWEPYLAEKWKISSDHKHFTFTLRKNAKWSDGTPVTAKDVVFSFKAYKDPSFGGAHYMPYYENIESAEALSQYQVRFKARQKYFNNFSVLAGLLTIIPEHVYKDKDKKFTRILPGSGPYLLKQYIKGKHIILSQNPNWWGRQIKPNTYRIKQIVFKFISDENDQLIRMQAGDLDFLDLSAESYETKTNKPPWGVSIIKKQIRNKKPSGYNYIGWNLNNPLFQNRNTRKALAHLMNRKMMNQKFNYGKRSLATGPWYSWNDYADQSIVPIDFNPLTARTLLAKAGWKDTDKNGVLDKIINDKKTEFQFTLIYPNKDSEKYFTIYQQDLKKNGINMSLRFMDWSAFLKLIHDKKFAAVSLGWSGGFVDVDPKQVWHSESSRKGGSNFISYKNPTVDKLIDKGRMEMNRNKRIPLFKKVYRLIAKDYPYVFIFNAPTHFYAHSRRVIMEKDTYSYGLGMKFWQISQQ